MKKKDAFELRRLIEDHVADMVEAAEQRINFPRAVAPDTETSRKALDAKINELTSA